MKHNDEEFLKKMYRHRIMISQMVADNDIDPQTLRDLDVAIEAYEQIIKEESKATKTFANPPKPST